MHRPATMTVTQTVLIGSYTEPVPHAPHAKGPGILTIRLSGTEIRSIHTTPPSISGANPSYLAQIGVSDIYAANEVCSGTISHLNVGDSGLTLKNRYECGKEPCHVAAVEGGLLAACFGDGSVWSYMTHNGDLRFRDRWVCKSGRGVHQVLGIGKGRILACAPVEGAVYELHRSSDGGVREVRRVSLDGYVRHGVVSRESVFVGLAKERVIVELDIEKLCVVSRVGLGEGSGVLAALRMVDDDLFVSERGEGNDRIWCKGRSTWSVDSGGCIPRDFAIGNGILVAAHQDGRVGVGRTHRLAAEGVASNAVQNESGALASVLFVDY